eukprot:COSAG05_NODE_489_length_9314_cov_115.648655_5_plen_38_part_00
MALIPKLKIDLPPDPAGPGEKASTSCIDRIPRTTSYY